MRPLIELTIIIGLLMALHYNAREAHRHTHELACLVDHPTLCPDKQGDGK